MKQEDQVVSLEPAKRMKELGFEQKSLFWWCKYKNAGEYYLAYGNRPDQISAYTVAELGEMLPLWTDTYKATKGFHCKFWTGKPDPLRLESVSRHYTICADTEADARAKMLIYLHENNLL